jgi:hypothetical protein
MPDRPPGRTRTIPRQQGSHPLPEDRPEAHTVTRAESSVASDADGAREHLDEPEHFARRAALVIAAMHRAASARERTVTR